MAWRGVREAMSKAAAASSSSRKAASRSLNELLIDALKNASVAGDGDEEPEVLPAPEHVHDPSKIVPQSTAEAKAGGGGGDAEDGGYSSDENGRAKVAAGAKAAAGVGGQEPAGRSKGSWRLGRTAGGSAKTEEEADRMMEEEERRVAALSFDPDALLPFDNMMERAKYIPLRLTYEERKSLRMVNAAIGVSDYTNSVDVQFKNKAKRSHTQLQYIVAFMSGIVAATDYEKGQEVLKDRNFEPYEGLIRDALEIARRYKITNPEKMRSEYGKLVYLLQDAVLPEMLELLGVNISKPIKTVYALLEAKGGLAMLEDPALGTATQEILPEKKERHTIQNEIKRKERAVAEVVKRHSTRGVSGGLKEDDVRLCLYSIGDNNSFLNSNRKPITDCIALLQQYFAPPQRGGGDASLAIDVGQGGARLSHSHEMQYNYVSQSLHLWAAIIEDTFRCVLCCAVRVRACVS